MTTKRILEITDADLDAACDIPDCAYGGVGLRSRGTKEARAKRAKAIIAMVRHDLEPNGATFEEAEAMAKLRGRVI